MGVNLSHFRCLACWVVLFRCPRPLNRGVRLIEVSFKVNKGNKFGDFGYCLLNRGCPLNTGFTVILFLIRRKLTTEYDQMRLTTITTCNKYNKVYLRIPKVST